jgi:hypothetical protein
VKTQSGSFGHSVCLFGWKEDIDAAGFYDPLYSQDTDGLWAKWADIDNAAWSGSSAHSYTPVASSGGGGGGDLAIQASAGIASGNLVTITNGMKLCYDAELKRVMKTQSGTVKMPYIGIPLPGEPGRGVSRAVLVNTGIPYEDGVTRPTIVYIPVAAVVEPTPPPTTPPPDCPECPECPEPIDCEQQVADAVAARDAAWTAWSLSGSPVNPDPDA